MVLSMLSLVDCSPAETGGTDPSVESLNSAVTIEDGEYEVRSVHSGKCAAVQGASQTTGASVVQLSCDGSASRRWRFQRVGTSTSTYRATAVHSGDCLAVSSNSTSNGLRLVQAACSSSAPNQVFRLVDSSGAVLLKPQATGAENRKCVDVAEGSLADGARLIQWTCHGEDNQRWMLSRVGTGASGGSDTGGDTGSGGGGDTGGSTPPAGSVTVNYTVDTTTNFANPERGFYHHQETSSGSYSPLSQSTLTSWRTQEGVSLILRLFYLESFRNSAISTSYLDSMRTDFSRLRAAGLKAVVRFAYTSDSSSPYGDASPDRVLSHIAQLKPILAANADVIATVQAGFIGAWGEWYYTDYFGDEGSVSSGQWADRKAVTDALLAALPSTRTVQLRTPAFKQRFYGTTALSSAEAFTGTARARVGHHNDCFVASSDDLGTYSSVSADKTYLATENLYVPQGGETCATSSFSGYSNASADMERMHYSYLNRDYLGAVYTSWGSNLDVVKRRLGYRLALTSGTFQPSARPGSELQLQLTVRNDGYAPPFNPRGVEILARNTSTGALYVAKVNADPRRFVPGASRTIDARLCLPATMPAGSYALSLALPDPEPTLHDRPEYAIRLANSGLWDPASGANSLKQTVTVSTTATATACSTGSVPLSPK
jgi:hypothetical protein